MADTDTAAPAPESSSPAAPFATALESLDSIMEQAATAANARAAVEAQNPPERDGAALAESDTDAAPVDAASPAEPADDSAPESGDSTQPDASTGKPPSRREAARLAEELNQARTRAADLERQLADRTTVDATVRERYGTALGTPDERESLEATIANPETSWQDLDAARTRLAEMRRASQELAPLYAAVQESVFKHFAQGLDGLKALDGVDDTVHQSLYAAKDGVTALKLMHGIGEKAASARYEGQIAALKAEVSSLKTKQAATGAQPTSGTGTTPKPSNPFAALYGPNGLPTDEADRLVNSGALLGVTLNGAG